MQPMTSYRYHTVGAVLHSFPEMGGLSFADECIMSISWRNPNDTNKQEETNTIHPPSSKRLISGRQNFVNSIERVIQPICYSGTNVRPIQGGGVAIKQKPRPHQRNKRRP